MGIEDIQNSYTKEVERKLSDFEIFNMEIEEECDRLGKVLMEISLQSLPSCSKNFKSRNSKERFSKLPTEIVDAHKEN